MKQRLRIGTRGSALALAQAESVRRAIERHSSDFAMEIVPIRTTGDKNIDAPLAEIGGKGLFIREIEEALLKKEIDVAVHSVKDLPAVLPEGLELIVFPPREDARDVLLSLKYPSLTA
ncbi:MAG: hydroxymethylbilane synthase, partial [Vicinamibacteria bacterium]